MRLQAVAAPALLLSLFAFAPRAHAQDGIFTSAPVVPSYNQPPHKLHSPATPDPNFPLRVRLQLQTNTWDSDSLSYNGEGQFALASAPQLREHFSYDCHYSFPRRTGESFQAQWADASHHKLQVLLYDPREHKQHTCALYGAAH